MNDQSCQVTIQIVRHLYRSILMLGAIFGCLSVDPCYAIVVSVENNLEKETEGKLLEIDQITSTDAPKSRFRLTVYPNETKTIAAGSITSFTLSRVFPTHKLKYEVVCHDSEKELTISLRNVHEDKMGPACTLQRFGHWSRRSGTNWTYTKNNTSHAPIIPSDNAGFTEVAEPQLSAASSPY